MTSERLGSYRYDQVEDSEVQLQKLIESRRPKDSMRPFGLYILDGQDPAANIARVVEREVLDEFFGNDENEMAAEYSAYDPHSRFILVVDQKERKPAGVMRLISYSEDGFKSLNDLGVWGITAQEAISQHDIDVSRTFDIATITAAPNYRSKQITPRLYWGLYNLSLQEGIKDWVAILDENVRGLLADVGIKSQPICDSQPREYLGSSESTPVIMNVQQVAKGVKQESWLKYLVLGKGIGLRSNTSNPF